MGAKRLSVELWLEVKQKTHVFVFYNILIILIIIIKLFPNYHFAVVINQYKVYLKSLYIRTENV